MEAVNQWHLGAERSQGRIEETNPFVALLIKNKFNSSGSKGKKFEKKG